MAVQVARRLFTVDEYHQMAEAGILGEDDHVELIEGEIVELIRIGARHAGTVKRCNRLFSRRVGDRAVVSVQDPVHLSDHSEPQPDLALLRPRADLYGRSHPGPADVLLVIEVADTSLDFDRQTKLPLYACAGIPEAWLLDLPSDAIEVHREPAPDGYRVVQRLGRDERLAPWAFPDLELAVDELLG